MHEVATILMRAIPGWIEHKTSDATFMFEFHDALVTVFSDGSWRCTIPQGLTHAVSEGTVQMLEKFLKQFEAANSL